MGALTIEYDVPNSDLRGLSNSFSNRTNAFRYKFVACLAFVKVHGHLHISSTYSFQNDDKASELDGQLVQFSDWIKDSNKWDAFELGGGAQMF